MKEENVLDILCTNILAYGVPSATLGAYSDEIRRECADRAIAWAKRYDGDDGYEVIIDKICAVIIGKEDS